MIIYCNKNIRTSHELIILIVFKFYLKCYHNFHIENINKDISPEFRN